MHLIVKALIGLHVAAALLPIRNWPLTDYPMFSKPVESLSDISRIRVVTVYVDRSVPWRREDYSAVGLHDHRLQVYANDINNPRIDSILGEKIRRRPEWRDAIAFRLIRRTLALKNGEIIIHEETAREIPRDRFLL